ncbi:glutaminase [Flavobacterium sp. MMS24-S5]|uniref:glutaminase n=1 Tax=Flavobacterium sp. MMS24-S5 TaxID=3416605 RepID=UPI003D075661
MNKQIIFVGLMIVFVINQGYSQIILNKQNIENTLNEAFNKFKDLKEGKNADYIQELANVDPNIFGIALVTAEGAVYTKGDITSMVSIQSISKVFTMAKVIEQERTTIFGRQSRGKCDRIAI